MKLPALFVGHGSPMNALDANASINQGFAEITKTFAKPTAILCISAHWYEPSLLFSFIFLYLAVAGGGSFSLDNLFNKKVMGELKK